MAANDKLADLTPNYAVFCNETIAFVHSLGMKTARKYAEKVGVWYEYVGYCVTHWQQ
nr:hypothetical protein [Nostoc sp. ChiQUE02]MDZ8234393.1 hypothetical protein [Nostoc sp. ChiQUE02]